ncbi:hypothetical protein ACFQ6O_38420 [Streptomyces sp. NPDC056441]|uniref:hypothetical protein n=1 Tax=Streptomyces sp. NPDC056441 TaxID=3345817 RepID=UPI0036BEE28C
MNWGDVPSWGALAAAVTAVVISVIALKHSKKAATAAERSADAQEVANAATARAREEAREARLEAARPKPQLKVEAAAATPEMGVRRPDLRYVLRNVGTGDAVGITVVLDEEPGRYRNLPSGETLRPGQGHEFRQVTAAGMTRSTEIHVTWDGQDEPVALPLPQ